MVNRKEKPVPRARATALAHRASRPPVTRRAARRAGRATDRPILDTWGATARKAAERIMDRYGPPQEVTPSRLVWFGAGPWKRVVVHRDEVPHDFPKPHTDLVEQVVDYRVPVERIADLARFHGSIVVDRTRGEVGVHCDSEEMNTLALNLMHDIVKGARTIEDARAFHAEMASGVMLASGSELASKLQFAAQPHAAERDAVVVAGPMGEQAVGRTSELAGVKTS